MTRAFCELVPGGVRVHVRVSPKASRDAIEGLHEDANGERRLKIRVRAVPEKGAANDSVRRLLAAALGLAPSRVALTGGAQDRNKTFLIVEAGADLAARLQALVGEQA